MRTWRVLVWSGSGLGGGGQESLCIIVNVVQLAWQSSPRWQALNDVTAEGDGEFPIHEALGSRRR